VRRTAVRQKKKGRASRYVGSSKFISTMEEKGGWDINISPDLYGKKLEGGPSGKGKRANVKKRWMSESKKFQFLSQIVLSTSGQRRES